MPFFDDFKLTVQQLLLISSSSADPDIDNLEQAYKRVVKLIAQEFDPEIVSIFSTSLHKVSYSELRAFKKANFRDFSSLGRLKEEVESIQYSSASSSHDLVRKVQLETEIITKIKKLGNVFKQVITARLFDKLAEKFKNIDSTMRIYTDLSKLTATDVAAIISVYVDNIVESNWVISWRHSESYFQKSIQATEDAILQDDLENLELLTKGIYDQVLMAISNTPQFYQNTKGDWRILDSEMVSLELLSNANYNQIISKIDGSGQTGIGYVLENPPTPRSPATQVLDKLLTTWHAEFSRLLDINMSTYQQMLMLNDHDFLLRDIDNFFAERIQQKLPQSIKSLPCLDSLRRELSNQRSNYDVFSEEEEDLSAQISELEDQIEFGEQQRAMIDIESLTQRVTDSAAHHLKVERDDGEKWAQIFYTGLDHQRKYLSPSELKCLVAKYIEELQRRDWKKLDADTPGVLYAHLQVRRQEQNEMRSNAEGSLRINPTDDSDRHALSSTEIRDAVNRNAYIDTATGESAEIFRDIIIAANILVYGGGSAVNMLESITNRDVIRSALAEKIRCARAEKQEYRPSFAEIQAQHLEAIDAFVNDEVKFGRRDYIKNVLATLHSFVAGNIDLPAKQMAALQSSRIRDLVTRFSRKQDGLVSGYSDSLSNLGVTKVRKSPEQSDSEEYTEVQQAKKYLSAKAHFSGNV